MSFEKMSKSKHNGVDPTDLIARYGADPTRAHMIFQAPVVDPLNWDEEKITGVLRWMERLHKQVLSIASGPSAEPGRSVMEHLAERHAQVGGMSEQELERWNADAALWRTTQRTIRSVTATYDEMYFINTVVSDLMNLTNALAAATSAAPIIRRETTLALIKMLYPIAPALASECHSILDPTTPITSTSFPVPDESDALTQPRLRRWTVQINGKFRASIHIDPAPEGLAGDELGVWVRDQILKTEEGQERFGGEGGEGKKKRFDVTRSKRVITRPEAEVINFVL
jgi:leucyl-tRNA synthetase